MTWPNDHIARWESYDLHELHDLAHAFLWLNLHWVDTAEHMTSTGVGPR